MSSYESHIYEDEIAYKTNGMEGKYYRTPNPQKIIEFDLI